jgi:hypothetical protein
MQISERDVAEFRERRRVIERVHRRLGLPCSYSRGDFQNDERALRESTDRKRRRRAREEAEFIEAHGERAWFAEWEEARNPRGPRDSSRKKTEAVA